MLVKRAASHQASRDDLPSDDSSSQGDDFVISPCPRRATRKTTRQGDASSSQGDEEATNMAEGQAVRQAREARASDIIQKVEHPLQDDYEYTLRRVDHHHPHAYGFHKGRESIYDQ
jgi:NAD(P)H-dependent flavin oxidoreductase YrpB (nitropropane dioxygenase family)